MKELERALLIGVNINNQDDFQESMQELGNLAAACELTVAGTLEQNLKSVHPAYYMGSGKVEEVRQLLGELKVQTIVFNNELSSSQLRNLEKELQCRIIDRTALILEIFAKRAKTREAKLQVEVARLQYLLPMLVGANEDLGRQTGGVGTRNRGSGEKKLELDRRKIEEKISELSRELELLAHERQTQRRKRSKAEVSSVALVGYTNAGKSTLMNAILELNKRSEDKKVLEKDMLFATLETSVRRITLSDHKMFLLSDTVGFVSKLPHHLVKAFRSTLEEVREADLLLHVVDYSNPNYQQQIDITKETLNQIGAGDIPVLYVYNKSDLTPTPIPVVEEDRVFISAKERIGVSQLLQCISNMIFKEYIHCKLLIPYDQGGIVAFLNQNAHVEAVSYQNDGTLLTLECKESDFRRFEQFLYTE